MRKKRVLHISTAHRPYDPRIVYKQCPSLAERYEVYCAIPDADASVSADIHFIRLPFFKQVILRLLITCPLIVFKTIWLRPAIIHIYVPEFLPFAYLYRLLGASVVYEVQENLFKKMHLKSFNRGWLLEKPFYWLDHLARKHFFFVLTEHGYLNTYTNLSKPYAVVYNYPLLSFLEPYRRPYRQASDPVEFFYIGWISFERSLDTMLEAFALLKEDYPHFRFHLFGRRLFTQERLESVPAYQTVKDNFIFYDYADQRQAFSYAAKAVAGLALLKPLGDYPESYTTKMFEYMALGLPVITSDFLLYQDVVERHDCGFCLNPYNAILLAEKLRYLIENPAAAEAMGQRGIEAAKTNYNWDIEKRKLINLYEIIEQY
ncbi:glycosyltransferase [Tellurirhabdus bombi]|uniref:glycosyltransferase n=1 Tax=Tellurirhabdus bombi TaxID=2907205 RepID=UPI001F391FDE|nr:glycosyltransferase [Tellurirhabdus bombi]